MMKKKIEVGSKVKFNQSKDACVFTVLEIDGFTLAVVPDEPVPSGYKEHARQYVDVSVAVLA